VSVRWLVWGVAAALGSVAAFVYLDPIIAAFVAIMLVTAVAMAFAARDWDRHATFEQRELERARRRAEKWERGKDARERDRVKWEAHRARQEAKKTAQPER
jgi:phosphate/sulfate permease